MKNKQPIRTSSQGTHSLEDFLTKMEEGPKTFGWDALLVFDRGATNTLLAQEYVDRIDTEDEFFPTLPDDAVESGNGIEHVLHGLVLDKPRLSFENASILESKAKLQMRLVGGQQLEVIETFLDGKPVRRVNALSVYNAANGSVLDMNIRLEATAGSVNESGKVMLDISKGFDHVFSGAGTELEKLRLGEYFKQVLNDWSDEDEKITQFPLSEIVVDQTTPVNPGVFGLRTHAAPGATVRSSQAYGDGAVIVFVAMAGNEKGTYPADDAAMLYMLPEASQPYTSNLVLSNKFIVTQVLESGFNQFEWLRGKFTQVKLPDGTYKLVASNASEIFNRAIDYHDGEINGSPRWWQWTFAVSSLAFGLFSKGDEVTVKGRKLAVAWRSSSTVGTLVFYIQTNIDGFGRTVFIPIDATFSCEATYKFTPSLVEGKTVLTFGMEDFEFNFDISIDDSDFGSGEASDSARGRLAALKSALSDAIAETLKSQAESLKNMTFEIDALRLNKLLFRGDNVVEPRDVSLPTDLTLLGNLAPKRTTLSINPPESTVASGQVIEFKAIPDASDVTWKVENLPGETGETGKFEKASGRYTAPSDEALRTEGHRRLIVTATSGDHVSKALVSVVPSQVSVNPWVAVVAVGKSYSLSAGTPDAAPLKWDTPALGAIAPESDPLNPLGYKYTAPASLPKYETGKPQHYRVLRLDSISVRPEAGGASATIDMLVVGAKNPNYWLEPEARDDGSVALPFYRLNLDLEKIEVPEPVEWTVLRGSGTVDPKTRVYTPAADADDQYVIISAYYVNDDDASKHDYVVLPLPVVSVRRHAEMLNPVRKEV